MATTNPSNPRGLKGVRREAIFSLLLPLRPNASDSPSTHSNPVFPIRTQSPVPTKTGPSARSKPKQQSSVAGPRACSADTTQRPSGLSTAMRDLEPSSQLAGNFPSPRRESQRQGPTLSLLPVDIQTARCLGVDIRVAEMHPLGTWNTCAEILSLGLGDGQSGDGFNRRGRDPLAVRSGQCHMA